MTMNRFAIVRDLNTLSDLMSDLEAWTAARSPLGPPREAFSGVWIEHPDDAAVSCRASAQPLADGPARLQLQLGPGKWMICHTEQPVSAATLISELKAAAGVHGATRARFAPVYGDEVPQSVWEPDWLALSSLYPGLVLRPLLRDSVGRLNFAESAPAPVMVWTGTRRGA